MVQLSQAYDVADLPQERTGFDPLPPDTYIGMVVDSKEKTTGAGGKMIVLEIDVQEGQYAGRKIFENLNIVNNNPKAEKIAFEALGELSHAIKLTGQLKNTEQLHNKRFQMTLKVNPPREYEATDPETGVKVKKMSNANNSVTKFLPIGADAPKKPDADAPAADKKAIAAEPAKGKTAPWKANKKA